MAGCNGLLTSIGLTLIGIPYGLILGILTGALSIVPFLGIVASILPALLLGFLSSEGGWVATGACAGGFSPWCSLANQCSLRRAYRATARGCIR